MEQILDFIFWFSLFWICLCEFVIVLTCIGIMDEMDEIVCCKRRVIPLFIFAHSSLFLPKPTKRFVKWTGMQNKINLSIWILVKSFW